MQSFDANGQPKTRPINAQIQPATNGESAVSTSGGTITLTLAAPGAGKFHYITAIVIQRTAGTGAANSVTTTNLDGSPAFLFETTESAHLVIAPTSPIKSTTANTATTFVAPAVVAVTWRMTVWFYTDIG